jgi:hypothetical protein
MPRRGLLAAALVVPALALGACGQTQQKSSVGDFKGDERAVAQAVEDLQSAGQSHDGNKICEQLLARELVRTIEQASGGNCRKVVDDALQDADAFGLTVQKVAISGTTATVTVRSDAGKQKRTDQLSMVRDGRNWKVSALGSSTAAG